MQNAGYSACVWVCNVCRTDETGIGALRGIREREEKAGEREGEREVRNGK